MSRVLGENRDTPTIIGDSPRIQELLGVLQKAAAWDANVCIQGENGTGKELAARLLHLSGPRRNRPFVTLDCSTIAEGLIESHLFGHVRGAFTGAVATRPGVFAQAHTGTLFIDEITELAPHLQSKLLRAIQSGEFTMVGGSQSQRVDVRIVTATNRNLKEAVAQGRFREDLYFRISVVRVEIPPLRERRDDIPLLVAHFLRRFMASRYAKHVRGLTAEAMELLIAYDWPGNIRQLENAIEQAMVLVEGDLIDVDHFPSLLTDTPTRVADELLAGGPPRPGQPLEQVERWYILETLKRVGGNRTMAARQLGISLRGLQYKLRRYAELGEADVHRPILLPARSS